MAPRNLSKPRSHYVGLAAQETWPGTEAMVTALIDESRFSPGWKPLRAAMLQAQMDLKPRQWMFPEEFAAWWGAAGKKRAAQLEALNAVNMKARTVLMSIRGERVITKVEALACAHFAMRLDPPEILTAEEFNAWFAPRFGSASAIAEALDVTPPIINDRLRGFDILQGRRHDRRAEPSLIRALDWVWRFGPLCPYGARQPVTVWPGQDEGAI